MMNQNIQFESRHRFWLWVLHKHSLLSGKSEGLPGDPVSDLRAVAQSFCDNNVPECLLMATAQSIFASQDISAPHSARPVVVEALSIALSPDTHIDLTQACLGWISRACLSEEGLGMLLNVFYECCSWFFNGRCESTAVALERVSFVLEKLLRGLFMDRDDSSVNYGGLPSSTGNLIFQFLFSSLPLCGSKPKLVPYSGDETEGTPSTSGGNTLSNLLNACIMSRDSEAVRLHGFRSLAIVIVAAEKWHKTSPTVFMSQSIELFASHFIGSIMGPMSTGIRDSFQQKIRFFSLAWDVAILVPNARCVLVGGDCSDRPSGPLLQELLLKNKGSQRDKQQPCMLQTVATYKAGQLILFWLREQNCQPGHHYKRKHAASGTTKEWMPTNLLITLLQRYSDACEGEEGSLLFKAIEKMLSRLCQWKNNRMANALATLAMKQIVNSTLKDCKWDDNECNYYDNGIVVDESGGQDNNEECDDTVLASSLAFYTPLCLVQAIPVLRLLDAILSHSARQEALRTLAVEINQSALHANFKEVRANDIASWLLGCV